MHHFVTHYLIPNAASLAAGAYLALKYGGKIEADGKAEEAKLKADFQASKDKLKSKL